MRGAGDRDDDRLDLVVAGGWYAEFFARQDKLKPLKSYLRQAARSAKAAVRQAASVIAAALRDKPGAATTIVDRPRPKARKEKR